MNPPVQFCGAKIRASFKSAKFSAENCDFFSQKALQTHFLTIFKLNKILSAMKIRLSTLFAAIAAAAVVSCTKHPVQPEFGIAATDTLVERNGIACNIEYRFASILNAEDSPAPCSDRTGEYRLFLRAGSILRHGAGGCRRRNRPDCRHLPRGQPAGRRRRHGIRDLR